MKCFDQVARLTKHCSSFVKGCSHRMCFNSLPVFNLPNAAVVERDVCSACLHSKTIKSGADVCKNVCEWPQCAFC